MTERQKKIHHESTLGCDTEEVSEAELGLVGDNCARGNSDFSSADPLLGLLAADILLQGNGGGGGEGAARQTTD